MMPCHLFTISYVSRNENICTYIKYLCDSEINVYTITTLTTAVEQMNCKKNKITELDEQTIVLITNPDELTDAREFEDCVVENNAKVNWFIELNKNTLKPQALINPTTQPSTEMDPLQSNPQIRSISSASATMLSLEAN